MTPKKTRFRLVDRDIPSDFSDFLKPLGYVDCAPSRMVKKVFFDTFDWRMFNSDKSISVGPGVRGPEVCINDLDGNETAAAFPGGLPTGLVSDFPNGHIRTMMAAIIDVRRLLPRLEVASRRTPIAIRNKEGKVVLRFIVEKCSVRDPGRPRTLSLGRYLTVEPIRGYAKMEAKARDMLNAEFALQPVACPLPMEGFHVVGVIPGDYSAKLRLSLDPMLTSVAAVRQIHLTLLDAMIRNEEGTVNNTDPEYLHDFRVAVRRTRSALGQLDKGVLPAAVIAKAKKDFRWIGQQTNHMRDLDVYLIDYPHLQSALPAAYKPYLQPFQDHLITLGRKESKRVAAMIRGKRYKRIRDDWQAYLTSGFKNDITSDIADMPVKDLADRRIWKAYRQVMKQGGIIDDNSPAESLHDLRITCKKLRYLLEFFQSLYPPRSLKALVKSLKTLQNVLGEFQDSQLQSEAILNFGRDLAAAGSAPVETQMAMGMVAESILARQGIARAMFSECFDTFSRREVEASFVKLFKNRE